MRVRVATSGRLVMVYLDYAGGVDRARLERLLWSGEERAGIRWDEVRGRRFCVSIRGHARVKESLGPWVDRVRETHR